MLRPARGPSRRRAVLQVRRDAVHAGRVLGRRVPFRTQHGPRQLHTQRRHPRGVDLRPVPGRARSWSPRAASRSRRSSGSTSSTSTRAGGEPEHADRPVPRCSPAPRASDHGRPLAQLNLERGVRLKLPAGGAVAAKMGQSAEPRGNCWTRLPGIDRKTERRPVSTPRRSGTTCCVRLRPPATTECDSETSGAGSWRKCSQACSRAIRSRFCTSSRPGGPRYPEATDADFTMTDLVRFAQGAV